MAEVEYASKGVAGAGLGTGIAGLALGVLNGGLNGILGGGCNNGWNAGCSENHMVNRYELAQESRIGKLESEIALRDANIYNDQKALEMYKYFDGEIKRIDRTLCEQAVYNATQTGAIACIQGQIAQLQGLTKLVVPNTSVCPGWGGITITPSTTPTTAG
jgi:hypothetical protein